MCCVNTAGGSSEHCGLKAGDELVAVNGAPLSAHYLESVVAVIDQVIHQGPLEFSIRRYTQAPPTTHKPRLPSAEKTPPPLPEAPPPQFPVEQAFIVEADDWTYIDDEFSRDLDNILEEDPESGVETGYVSSDDASVRAASLRKRNQLLGLSTGTSEEHQTIVEGNSAASVCLFQSRAHTMRKEWKYKLGFVEPFEIHVSECE